MTATSVRPVSATLPPALTDQQCIALLNAGDLDGFAALYGHHHRAVEAAARLLAGRRRAPHVTSEAFARLLLLLLDGCRPGRPVRYTLLACVREGCSRAGAAEDAQVPGLPPDWRGVLRGSVCHHLTHAPESHELRCRSADLVDQLVTSIDQPVVPGRRHARG